jgi:hypothetical protein
VRLRRAGACKAWDGTVVAWSTHRAESLRSNEALSLLRRVFETINLAKSTQQGVGFILRRNHYLGYAPENYILNYLFFRIDTLLYVSSWFFPSRRRTSVTATI